MSIVGIAALALVLLIVASGVVAKRAEVQLSAIQDRYLPKIVLQPELDASFERLRRGFQDAVAAHDLETLAATTNLKQHFLDQLAAAEGAVEPDDSASLRGALEDYYAAA